MQTTVIDVAPCCGCPIRTLAEGPPPTPEECDCRCHEGARLAERLVPQVDR